ncbi:MAG: TonB family protein, partial [Phenylobacterium sp.]
MTVWTRTVLAAALIFCTNAAQAAERPAAVKKGPSEAETKAAEPAAAKQGVGGRALVRCKTSVTGQASDCVALRETPKGMGFADAVISLAPRYVIAPATRDGKPVEGEVLLSGDWYDFDKEPDWLKRPSADDMFTAWPTEAWKRGQSGEAVISCLVSLQGALFDCWVRSESPPGSHFGDAAIALTPQFLMKPASKQGRPVLSAVNIPIRFILPGGGGGIQSGMRRMANAAMTWLEAPSYADVAAAYPQKARTAKVGGRATLGCSFTAEGRINQCHTVSETPTGLGFAAAAKELAKRFRAQNTMADGKSVKGMGLQLPVVFDPVMLSEAPPVIGKPSWTRTPDLAQTQAAFAKVTGLKGPARVLMRCIVQPGGTVGQCQVESETPSGHGLNEAALAMAPGFLLTTWSAEGLPTVGGAVRIPIRYELAPETP